MPQRHHWSSLEGSPWIPGLRFKQGAELTGTNRSPAALQEPMSEPCRASIAQAMLFILQQASEITTKQILWVTKRSLTLSEIFQDDSKKSHFSIRKFGTSSAVQGDLCMTGTWESLRQHLGSISTALTMGQILLNRNLSRSEFSFVLSLFSLGVKYTCSIVQNNKESLPIFKCRQWKYVIALGLFCCLFTYICTAFSCKRLFCRIQRRKKIIKSKSLALSKTYLLGSDS